MNEQTEDVLALFEPLSPITTIGFDTLVDEVREELAVNATPGVTEDAIPVATPTSVYQPSTEADRMTTVIGEGGVTSPEEEGKVRVETLEQYWTSNYNIDRGVEYAYPDAYDQPKAAIDEYYDQYNNAYGYEVGRKRSCKDGVIKPYTSTFNSRRLARRRGRRTDNPRRPRDVLDVLQRFSAEEKLSRSDEICAAPAVCGMYQLFTNNQKLFRRAISFLQQLN